MSYPPPGSTPNPAGGVPPTGLGTDRDQEAAAERDQQAGAPKRRGTWIWPLIVVLAALGVLAGVIASNNKSKSPSTVVNQQTTSTTNSLGVSVQSSQPTHTSTVTAPTKTVTAPAQTVTSTAPASTTPTAATQTSTTPATAP
jgi:hypothetical protein